mmetsp:Transcript_22031/g.48131  ORF Transcript_22031/g.48131 Transcript_22031/m.48131 type:complete len:107 (-) Transcript_22031:134-454(-)
MWFQWWGLYPAGWGVSEVRASTSGPDHEDTAAALGTSPAAKEVLTTEKNRDRVTVKDDILLKARPDDLLTLAPEEFDVCAKEKRERARTEEEVGECRKKRGRGKGN